jgi:large subunit ribosomal protein L29
MKTSEIIEMTIGDIEERIENEKTHLQQLELNHSVSPLDNPVKIRHARRNIARLMTILRQKQLQK